MKNFKKTLKVSGILCFVIFALNILLLCVDFKKTTALDFTLYIIEILLSLITGIIYLVFSRKTHEEIISKKSMFFVIAIINLLNSSFAWIIAFYVYFAINKEFNKKAKENKDDENDIVLNDSDYDVKKDAEILTEKLNELKSLKDQNLITEEEYEKLMQEALNNFINKL